MPNLYDLLVQWTRSPQQGPSEFARQFYTNLSPTGSIPSTSDLRTGARRVGDIWANPSPQAIGDLWNQGAQTGADLLGGIAELARNPMFTIAALLKQARDNPWGSAGGLTAMMLPGPGGKKLASGTPDDFLRLANEEARIRQFNLNAFEGPATSAPLHTGPVAEFAAESGGDLAALATKADTRFLAAAVQASDDPQHKAILLRELHKRGWRGDISDAEHIAREGHPTNLVSQQPNIWTREERGAQELQKLGIQPPWETTGGYDNPLITKKREPDAFDLLKSIYKGEPPPVADPTLTFHYDRAEIPRDVSAMLSREFPNAPIGQAMWRNGERWTNTRKGWTLDPDAPKASSGVMPTDLLHQMIRVTREKGAAWGVEEGIKHGGLTPEFAAGTIRSYLMRSSKAGAKLTPEQNAWLELFNAQKYKPKP